MIGLENISLHLDVVGAPPLAPRTSVVWGSPSVAVGLPISLARSSHWLSRRQLAK